jgi:hypothetical protein
MMDEATIRRVIEEQGYRMQLRRVAKHSAEARSAQTCSVYAWNGNAVRSLGNFEEVSKMSEEALRNLIAARFAQPARGSK